MVKLVQEYFTESAKNHPNKPAVDVWHEEKSTKKDALKISFDQLEKYSNRLARHLKNKGVRRGDRIALAFMKVASVEAIASILAILKCDATYVPVSHILPAERVAKVLDDSGASFMICRSHSAKELKNHPRLLNFKFIELDYNDRSLIKESDGPLVYENSGDDIAYIMYTSGSTGIPKGVQITHANIINATDWAVEEFGITSKDKISQHPPLNFDLSTFDLYCAFKSGATLCPVLDNLSLFPGDLLRMIEESKITIWDSVPSVMVYLWNSGLVKSSRIPTVKKIFFNGEGFPTKYLAEWMKVFPKKKFINMYGPTETTVQCTFYRISETPRDLTKLVPIGKACRGVEVFDVNGELYVAGRGVSPGYWNDSEKTEKSFIHDPRPGKTGRVYKTGDLVKLREDGNYEFVGRKDNQVKIHGYRIELGDIDSALYSLSYVNEAATIAVREHETGDSFLVAFIDLKLPKPETDIKIDLGRILPSYMIPKRIIEKKLPKTGTGKIDRQKLKHEYEQRG